MPFSFTQQPLWVPQGITYCPEQACQELSQIDGICSTCLVGESGLKDTHAQDSIWKVKAMGMTGMAGKDDKPASLLSCPTQTSLGDEGLSPGSSVQTSSRRPVAGKPAWLRLTRRRTLLRLRLGCVWICAVWPLPPKACLSPTHSHVNSSGE